MAIRHPTAPGLELTAAGVLRPVKEQALEEIREEDFRAAVAAEKQRIRNRRPWWKRLLSIRITITGKE